jgi:hypothetical protein
MLMIKERFKARVIPNFIPEKEESRWGYRFAGSFSEK